MNNKAAESMAPSAKRVRHCEEAFSRHGNLTEDCPLAPSGPKGLWGFAKTGNDINNNRLMTAI